MGIQEQLERYWVELISVWIGFIFLITLIRGIRKNYEISIGWFEILSDFLESQFSRSGFIKKSFLSDSWSHFDIFSTGRRNCKFMYMNVICKPRQDLLTGVILQPLLKNYDKVYVEIPVDSMGPIVLFICNRICLKETFIEYPEIEIHSTQKKLSNVPRNFVIYSNSNACIEMLLISGFFSKFVNSSVMERLVNYIYISDVTTCPRATNSYSKLTNVIKCCFKLPSKKDIEDIKAIYGDQHYILRNLINMCDLLPTVKLPEKTLHHISKGREEIERVANRMNEEKIHERIEAKRREKIKQENLKVSKMTPKEQKKYQEKKERQNMRSRIKVKKIRG
ncbi:hypothetical protein FG386_003632 [Cryptosporidium ryanae]|uniref:uncharacterized protein n=1 Tax=Cryptosporidium ryanae TaxID=515981 RepID=UPI00351A3128|nr:hypothetical protein FG386_003632 [Cryptosporidium ryanae]